MLETGSAKDLHDDHRDGGLETDCFRDAVRCGDDHRDGGLETTR